MCTLIIVHRVNEKYPLIIAANRDENYDRPSEEPDTIQMMPLTVVAPKDLRSGGTWMGAAQGGWFVGLTNQDDGKTILGKKSRGQVVRDCLLLGNHRLTTRYLVGLNTLDYNPFNLVFGRPDAMFLCRIHHDRKIDLEIIDEGVTIITNDCSGSGSAYAKREATAMKGALSICANDTEDEIVTKLEKTLCMHDKGIDLYQSLCVHDDEHNFGTKSSSVVLMTKDGSIDYFHSEGHPCVSSGLSLRNHISSIDEEALEFSFEGLSDENLEKIE